MVACSMLRSNAATTALSPDAAATCVSAGAGGTTNVARRQRQYLTGRAYDCGAVAHSGSARDRELSRCADGRDAIALGHEPRRRGDLVQAAERCPGPHLPHVGGSAVGIQSERAQVRDAGDGVTGEDVIARRWRDVNLRPAVKDSQQINRDGHSTHTVFSAGVDAD